MNRIHVVLKFFLKKLKPSFHSTKIFDLFKSKKQNKN